MFPEVVALFSVDHESEHQKFNEQEGGSAEKEIYYLLTDCKCPIYFFNNAEALEAAKWLAAEGFMVSERPEPPKDVTP